MQNLVLLASTTAAFQLIDAPSLAETKSSATLLKEDACAGTSGLTELQCTAKLAQKFAQRASDTLRLAQQSFPSRKVALAEETATEQDVQGMKSWEIVLIVLGVAIGILCVIFVVKQMGVNPLQQDEEKKPDEECEEAMMMEAPQEEQMMEGEEPAEGMGEGMG